jgi:hypothetical protein
MSYDTKFTPTEMFAISRALSVAATVYDDDAALMRSQGMNRIAEHFEAQATEARALAERIDS